MNYTYKVFENIKNEIEQRLENQQEIKITLLDIIVKANCSTSKAYTYLKLLEQYFNQKNINVIRGKGEIIIKKNV